MRATNVLAVDFSRRVEQLEAENARLRARLAAYEPRDLRFGPLTIDLRAGAIYQAGDVCGQLTRTELRLLKTLAAVPGVPATREDIGRTVWPDFAGLDLDRAIRVNMARLRAKVDPASLHIRTVTGVGYAVYTT
jgi:DNA-binding response OmpR family regulator